MGVIRRGDKWCIRYYGPDGRQRWETVGPNRKEAETVLAQRIYEVRSGKYPILRRRSRLRFGDFATEWLTTYAEAHVRASTLTTYRWLINHHLVPAFGAKPLGALTRRDVEDHVADRRQRSKLSARTINHSLTVLNQMLRAAVDWGYLPTNPAYGVRKIKIPRKAHRIWTLAEIRRFLLMASDPWRPLFAVAVFTGVRLGELQALAWDRDNVPNFTTNKLEITRAYNERTRVLAAPKSDHSVRAIDMVPSVREALRGLSSRGTGGLLFPGADGNRLSSWELHAHGWRPAVKGAEVSYIRFHDLRHTYASLLIMAGKHPKYIATQMGHASAAFTLDTYGHLMDRLPVRPVEWIDELVFPEGLPAALNLHLYGAPNGATGGNAVHGSDNDSAVAEQPKSLENQGV